MKPRDLVIQFRAILGQHIILIQSNSNLLVINLDLMKENDELKKEIARFEKMEKNKVKE